MQSQVQPHRTSRQEDSPTGPSNMYPLTTTADMCRKLAVTDRAGPDTTSGARWGTASSKYYGLGWPIASGASPRSPRPRDATAIRRFSAPPQRPSAASPRTHSWTVRVSESLLADGGKRLVTTAGRPPHAPRLKAESTDPASDASPTTAANATRSPTGMIAESGVHGSNKVTASGGPPPGGETTMSRLGGESSALACARTRAAGPAPNGTPPECNATAPPPTATNATGLFVPSSSPASACRAGRAIVSGTA